MSIGVRRSGVDFGLGMKQSDDGASTGNESAEGVRHEHA